MGDVSGTPYFLPLLLPVLSLVPDSEVMLEVMGGEGDGQNTPFLHIKKRLCPKLHALVNGSPQSGRRYTCGWPSKSPRRGKK